MNEYQRVLLAFALLLPLFIVEARLPSPRLARSFQSDFCTLWPDAAFNSDWSECCYQHDLYYWAGGTSVERKKADQRLKSCVEKNSTRLNGALMFWGIQIGALSPFKLKSQQWGNAWGDDVHQNSLGQDDIRQLEASLYLDLPPNMSHSDIDSFIEDLKSRP